MMTILKPAARLRLLSILFGLLAFICSMPPATAATGPITFTLYSEAIDGAADPQTAFGPEYLNKKTQLPNPGATFVQASTLHLRPDHSDAPLGKVYIACIQLLSPFDVQCTASFKFNNGAVKINGVAVNDSALTTQGYFSEEAGLSNNCREVNVQTVTGGTGAAFAGAQGQLSITHFPGPLNNPQVTDAFCSHSVHEFQFDFSLLQNQNGKSFTFAQ